MQKYAVLGLAALISATALPAVADWNHLGSATFTTRSTYYSARADFSGDRMALTSRTGDVYCRNVQATFGNGETRTIYKGTLHANDTVNVDLPGQVRGVQRLAFDCQPSGTSQATIDIAANTSGPQNVG